MPFYGLVGANLCAATPTLATWAAVHCRVDLKELFGNLIPDLDFVSVQTVVQACLSA